MKNLYKNKKILITGGLGMIGSNIAKKLVELQANVTIADTSIIQFGANLYNIKGFEDKIEVINADIRNSEDMKPLIKKNEIIFNLAGQVSHNDSIKDPFYDADINYIGQLNILEIAKKCNPDIKIIFAGTRMQYGKVTELPVSENHPQKPLSPYALNKSAAENLYLFYNRLYGVPVVIFRITNPYGPGGQIKHGKYNIVNWFIRQALEGNAITIYGDGKQIRDYIYIDDLVEAFILAGVKDESNGKVFNLGSGIATKFHEMARTIISEISSGSITNIPWPDNYINIETGDFVADITKISNMIDWKPTINLKEGIKKTCEYYRKNIKNYI